MTAAWPSGAGNGGDAATIPGACFRAASTLASAAASGLPGTTISSGPLEPGPNPSASRSKATRGPVPGVAVELSSWPRRSDSTGMVSASSTATPSTSHGHGRRAIISAHLPHPCTPGLAARWCRPGTFQALILVPRMASSAGSSVIEVSTAMTTTIAAE